MLPPTETARTDTSPAPVDAPAPRKVARVDLAAPAAFFILAMVVACYDVAGSGPLWPDAPRYANAGAMIHDWLASGDFRHPYRFALADYARYPGFSLPYHPPAYPTLLGLSFLATGVSYPAARAFIGLCLGGSGSLFFAILRRQGVAAVPSVGCALLLLTAPEIVLWSRDTMSEIPALVFVMAGTYWFMEWLRAPRPVHAWASFALAEV
ncbi:MAG: phospholipid carrier-dependent glycosyltransferase, partial [Planctomycetia bacterium]|nr:phospholipid carrier-dependent glycosyltransferase [Planctomycetia bacterium]